MLYENNWIVEPELSWERQVQREQDEIEDDPEPNSMYSLVRLFDKKKMEYFDENYKQSINHAISNINPKLIIVSPYCILHVADILWRSFLCPLGTAENERRTFGDRFFRRE
jgi:uncharacterized membrane protein YcjF (UPF0283 family)